MAPDIAFVHAEEADQYQWKVLKKLGDSDHHPILITREVPGLSRVNIKRKENWDIQNADWTKLR